MKKDYYKILGITDEEKKLKGEEFNKILKKKFRTLAIKLHPDKQQGKSESEKKKAEEEFKDINEAYSVLGDEKQRSEYDNPRSSFSFTGGSTADFSGFDDIFSHFRGGFADFDFGFSDVRRGNVKQRGSNLKIVVQLTLEDMFNGIKKKFKYKPFDTCPSCHGSGMGENTRKRTCKTCGGSGMAYSGGGFFSVRQTCPTCGGVGYVLENPCPTCNGHGITKTSKEITIDIPKGVYDGMNLQYRGYGNAAPHGGDKGDLIVGISQLPHSKFERKGDDLYFTLKLKVINALLGCKVNITTIDGKVLQAKIPQGTSDGYQMRFKGYGMPIYGTDKRGSMIATVKIIMPQELNDNEKKLLKELREQDNFK